MFATQRISLSAVVTTITVCLLCFPMALRADDLVLVRQNGQLVTGDFGPESNADTLYLTKQAPQMMLRTGHSWDEFQSLAWQGKEISKEELLQLAPQMADTNAQRNQQAEAVQFWFSPRPLYDRLAPPLPFVAADPFANPPSLRVAALDVDAYVANWDNDAELDGLIVHLHPYNDHGELVPVNGQIELRLIGQRYRELNWRGRNNPEKFPELEQWAKQVHTSDFGPDGAVIKLEFRRVRPELQTEIAAGTLLTGSLSVAGQGRFDASVADVVIRPFSRFRDELFLRSRSRSRVHPYENYPRPYDFPASGRTR